ncbi:hypothetical protein [Vreelandella janggokensis]|jgi:NADP-dependent 3-hydroxy acid dehydrogenase YdfG|uniref:hypothetical protein n=1 Tax=Vreelandella janggokensis TaxID=370767 RepID=UPI002863CB4E|nr:hypothetical protein [Halomonas janggokensis]MDR5884773.1 hypothetical protein [Halomonas janggokensis]
MPVNWEDFDSEIDSIIEESADATDDQLASRISSITRMTDEEIQELFPNPADVKKLAELMKIVKSSEDRNNKIDRIVSNAEEFGGIVLSLLQKLS